MLCLAVSDHPEWSDNLPIRDPVNSTVLPEDWFMPKADILVGEIYTTPRYPAGIGSRF